MSECKHPNKVFQDAWLSPMLQPPHIYLVKEYYCPDCKQTFTKPSFTSDRSGK